MESSPLRELSVPSGRSTSANTRRCFSWNRTGWHEAFAPTSRPKPSSPATGSELRWQNESAQTAQSRMVVSSTPWRTESTTACGVDAQNGNVAASSKHVAKTPKRPPKPNDGCEVNHLASVGGLHHRLTIGTLRRFLGEHKTNERSGPWARSVSHFLGTPFS